MCVHLGVLLCVSLFATRTYRVHKDKLADCRATVRALAQLMQKGIRARDIVTLKSFENAITVMQGIAASSDFTPDVQLAMVAVQRPVSSADHIVAVTLFRICSCSNASNLKNIVFTSPIHHHAKNCQWFEQLCSSLIGCC